MGFKNKNLHLIVSSLIILPIGLTYGLSPKTILIKFFELKVATTNIENIFRAMMGLYFGVTTVWIIGILKTRFWTAATLTNILFMGGLGLGRLLSFILDGIPSRIFIAGFFFEVFFAFWGLINLKKYNQSNDHK